MYPDQSILHASMERASVPVSGRTSPHRDSHESSDTRLTRAQSAQAGHARLRPGTGSTEFHAVPGDHHCVGDLFSALEKPDP